MESMTNHHGTKTRLIGDLLEPNAHAIESTVQTWLANPVLQGLAQTFGWKQVATGSVLGDLRDFEAWAGKNWDFREGSERWAARSGNFDAATTMSIRSAARDMGQLETSLPTQRRYDAIALFGGGFLSPLLRATFGRRCLDACETDRVVALGSERTLSDVERQRSAVYQDGAATEADLMEAGTRIAFGHSVAPRTETFSDPWLPEGQPGSEGNWRVRSFIGATGQPITVLSAPSTRVGQRANTADTVRFMRDQIPLPRGGRVLGVTTSHFVPFQHADLMLHVGLPCGVSVETVGYSVDTPREAAPEELLQEFLSGARSLLALCTGLAG